MSLGRSFSWLRWSSLGAAGSLGWNGYTRWKSPLYIQTVTFVRLLAKLDKLVIPKAALARQKGALSAVSNSQEWSNVMVIDKEWQKGLLYARLFVIQ